MQTSGSEADGRDRLLELLGLAQESGAGPDGSGPFSLSIGSAPMGGAENWERTISAEESDGHSVEWRHPGTGIVVAAAVRLFPGLPALDYVLHVVNKSDEDSPILEHIMPLDVRLSLTAGGPVTVYHAKGSSCAEDDFLPLQTILYPGKSLSLSPVGGRSSNGAFPFFNVTWPGGGMVVAVGWTGQWHATFSRDEEGRLLLLAGMAETRLRLRPGESIRTPRIVLLPWEGEDRLRGHNLFRRLMVEHYVPRIGVEIAFPPTVHNTASANLVAKRLPNESDELEAVRRCSELGLEAYWMDAYWFPQPWWQNVGNWRHREEDFPRGLRPLADAAHEAGMKFVLWFEPERVYRGTAIHKEHPEYLLAHGDSDVFLLDLGNPEARRYVTDLISGRVDELGIDIYRQDFNMDPLPYWRSNEEPDRVGMAEIRYVEGLYTFWAELRARHPHLTIDNCASGGRRIDVETCALSYPLWRSDFPDAADRGTEYRRVVDTANQVEHTGLSLYVPLHAGPVSDHDAYAFRSAMSTGVCLYSDIRAAGFPDEPARRGVAEVHALRHLMLGDFYPLTPITVDPAQWFALQYHRPDLGEGFALFFRRGQCRTPAYCASLRAIDAEATYLVSTSAAFDMPPSREMTGAELASLKVSTTQTPAAMLLRYERLKEKASTAPSGFLVQLKQSVLSRRGAFFAWTTPRFSAAPK